MPGTLFVVATPIGNLEDITLRALRVLREVAVIAAEDTRRTSHLLARHAIATPTTSLHEHNEARKSGSLVARLLNGDSIALVSDAGSPTIADPGRRLIADAIAAGIRVEPIPGPNAAVTALMASGVPGDSFSFFGFPPNRGKDRKKWFERALKVGGTIVFYEAPHRLASTLDELKALAGDCHVVVCREMTKIHEQLVRGPISAVVEGLTSSRGEFTIVAELGRTTDNCQASVRPQLDFAAKSRRQAVGALAELLGLPANEVYRALEELRNR